MIKSIALYEEAPLAITSAPVRLCICTEDNVIECNRRELVNHQARGGLISLLGIVVDQNQNAKKSLIRARYSTTDFQLDKGEGRIEVIGCTNLSYHVFTQQGASATLNLQPEGPCERSHFSSIIIHITMIPCPRGLEQSGDRCVCDGRLKRIYSDLVCNTIIVTP